MNELALFAGAGGGILGGKILGWRTICAVEKDAYCQSILLARQADRTLPIFPIWDNVETFDGRPWRGRVDIVSGGFPCQDISVIGKGDGLEGERSKLWIEMARVIGEVAPRFVFVENSPALTGRGIGRVLGDLSELGYDAVWGIIGADDAVFPHRRKRVWILGYPSGERLERYTGDAKGARKRQTQSGSTPPPGLRFAGWKRVIYAGDCDEDGLCAGCGYDFADCGCPGPTVEECQYGEFQEELWARSKIRFFEPDVGRVVDGLPARVDRLKAIGNAQVPAVAALAWRILTCLD